ncbi:lysylphosphatidylglycerol synthase transmembrane domain-containing protein [Corynebacterium heidelbergense]|uniref:TIGR00374 family protein n=1 Tax=Corynebacterium heidelbergense TaxID=2055947 RepID=A0A364V768_9CORY|nr:YbhN family protein [Corynebacterium heidelbergense]RAV32487.1 hypothetical protein DLJ54_03060 [Corynebacterium heidelbergense]
MTRPSLRSRRVRIALALVVLAVLAFFARNHLHFISEGWAELRQADPRWLIPAVIAQALTMVTQAEVMVVLLRSAGVKVRRWTANMLGLAANAWSASFPGGPALSAAMIFREQIKWGATPVIASWYMVISGALSGGGMAILGLGSVYFLGLRVKPVTLAISIAVLIALAIATNWCARNPKTVEQWLLGRLRAFNRWRRQPEDRWTAALHGFADQLSAVDLPLPRLGLAINWSLWNWIFEIICLWACVMSIGGEPPVAGVVLSFIAAKVAGQTQVTPGGLGPVDLALTSSLVAFAALTSAQAFAAVIVFRMLSFVGLVAIGWLVFFATKLATPRVRPANEAVGGVPKEKTTLGSN